MHHLEIWFRELRLPLLSYAQSITCNAQDAQDVVQEVFLECVAGKRQTGRAYLFQAVRNRCFNRVRGRRRLQLALQHYWHHLLRQLVDDHAMEPDWEGAFARLRPMHREVLQLRIRNELKIGEIALVLKIPEGTVKSRLNQAIKELRHMMRGGNGPIR